MHTYSHAHTQTYTKEENKYCYQTGLYLPPFSVSPLYTLVSHLHRKDFKKKKVALLLLQVMYLALQCGQMQIFYHCVNNVA